MPLKRLYIENTLVSDLSPIAGAPLEEFIAAEAELKISSCFVICL